VQSGFVKAYVTVGRAKLPVVLIGTVGLALVALGIPRTIAAWYSAEAEPALQELRERVTLPAGELATAIVALQHSLLWSRSAHRLSDLSLLELAQARELLPTDPQRNALLIQSERHLTESLITNPADGFAWLRLAVVREFLGAPRRDIAAPLIKSLDMAPNARALWLPRATMLFAYWLDLTSDELLAVKNHLQMVWLTDEKIRLPLLKAADRIGTRAFIGWALIGNDQALQEFDAMTSKLSPERTRR
jgi:hypothetical protein